MISIQSCGSQVIKCVSCLPAHGSLPTEGVKCVSAAVGGDVREGYSVNQQVEVELGEGRDHRTVSCRCDNGLNAVLQRSGKVHRPKRQNLCFWQL